MDYENLDELLVKLVMKFDNIYDKSNGMFKNRKVRDSTWTTISQLMKKPRDECQQRWNVLRTRYALERRKCRIEAKPSTWPLYTSMRFLDKFMVPRKSYGNYKTVSTTSELSPSLSDNSLIQSKLENTDPIFVDVEVSNDDDEHKLQIDEDEPQEPPITSLVESYMPIDNKPHWINSEDSFWTNKNTKNSDDAEYAFGRTIAIMLKNIRGHKKRRKIQAEIMLLLSKYDSGSDSE